MINVITWLTVYILTLQVKISQIDDWHMNKILHSVVLRTVKTFYITFCINVTMAIFTLVETDYLSPTGYPLDNVCKTNNLS